MTSERWTLIQDLYAAALDRPADEQSAFLRHACGEDRTLYDEVLSLLSVDVHPLFAGRAVDLLEGGGDPVPLGGRVGPYRLERRLGAGGMGTVYLAERADGAFEQVVALKLVKRGMDTEAVLARFHAERQILARLVHPHVARLLDGGATSDGRPYFAMEYVEGEPITDYCDARRLPVAERLRLVEAVCEAVAYAHRNLVVHRDLKPSNILVTEAGVVKLLDFGIAKLLTPGGGGVETRTGQHVLTPAYAAPEQHRAEAVTTATDVYGLGVVLYELLTGRRPGDESTREGLPVRPSAAVRQPAPESGGASPESRAHARATTPERLARRLRGDLDTIVLTALHDEPERRYASAEGLLADLRAVRLAHPIAARPDAVGYRLRKYVQRHRVGVAATLGVLLVVAALVGFYTARLAAERDRARLEAAKAAEVSAFLGSLFASSDPATARGADLTARELLAEGAARIERELAAQPAVQAELYGTIGEVYHALGLLDEAGRVLTESLRLHRAVGADPLTLARARTRLGDLRIDQGRFDEADTLLRQALAVQEADPDPALADRATTLEALAVMLQERGDYDEAEAPLLDALALQRTLHPGDHEATSSLLSSLGQTYLDLGRYDEAERTYGEALAMRRRLHGDLHPSVTASLRGYSTLHRRQKRYDEAEALIREAIRLDSQLVGMEHPSIGANFYEYASLLNDVGRFDDATRMFERTMAVDIATRGPDHPYVALVLGELGSVRQRAGDPAGAIAYYRRALAHQRRVLPPGHPEIATSLKKLGEALSATGAHDEAERTLREAVAVRRAALGDDHHAVLTDRSALAAHFTLTGRHDEAVAVHRDVLARRVRLLGDDSPTTARSYYNLANALRHLGTPEALDEARVVAEEAVARYRAGFPPGSYEIAYALREHADVLRTAGDLDAARALYREAHRTFDSVFGPDHPATRSAERALTDLGPADAEAGGP